MNFLWCWLFGHKKLELESTKKFGVMTYTVHDEHLLRIQCCERCHLVYWEAFHEV